MTTVTRIERSLLLVRNSQESPPSDKIYRTLNEISSHASVFSKLQTGKCLFDLASTGKLSYSAGCLGSLELFPLNSIFRLGRVQNFGPVDMGYI